MATGFLSDEKQIGARLEKEIEMYCSNKALERLKDIVARDSHREQRHIAQVLGFLHHLLTRQGNFRRPQTLRNIINLKTLKKQNILCLKSHSIKGFFCYSPHFKT